MNNNPTGTTRIPGALIVGATGATGKDLLALLLADNSIQSIDIFARRPLDIEHEKLKVHVIDFDKPGEWRHLVKGDVLFSCLGTTRKAAGSKAAQWKIDYDYQYQFAKTARENKVSTYVLVSSDFASPKSFLYYSKMKGLLEIAVSGLGFPRLIIFKPPMLIRKNSDRPGEATGIRILNFINQLGLFRSQKPLPTEILAQAMINAAKQLPNTVTILKGREIWRSAGES